ncbi:MAG TPA: biotin--[acetyl-CoA-carboxylase] ligase [Gemmatimonadaceae bacterium]|nr:biotin--[acetyl-CoA-carboxylase] ligase [Gemmatimonadaceae bacterium]
MTSVPMDGLDATAVAARLGLRRVVVQAQVSSTMDVAHTLASEGADAGTLVIANEQTAGRGRGGNRWSSQAGHGLWITLLERPESASGLDVLSLRVGLALARPLEPFAGGAVRVKWPNDLYVGEQKLGGILIEARWREQRPEWVAIGVGVNIDPPGDLRGAAGLSPGISRVQLLEVLVPALRSATALRGPLSPLELEEFDRRDFARGRECTAPAAGVAQGITQDGALIIMSAGGTTHVRGGSLAFAGAAR